MYLSLSSQEFGVGTSVSKVYRQSRTPRWHCEGWFWILWSIYRTRFVYITNDSRKDHAGQSTDAVSAKTQVNGWCSKIIENLQIGMSRHMDSSTTTQMARIMVQYGRPSRSSWANSVRSSFGRTTMGTAIWENPIEVRLGGGFRIGNAYSYTEKRTSFLCMRTTSKLAGKKQNIDPMWKVLNKEVDLGEPTSFLDHVYLGCTQRQCEISKDIVDNYRTVFESRISAVWAEKLPFPQIFRISSWSYDMEVMPRSVWNDIVSWQTRQHNNSAKYLLPCIHFKARRIEICRRIVTSMLSNCSEMFVLGTNWTTWYSVVSKQTCTIDYKMDQSLWQTPESIRYPYIHHTCDFKQYC